MNTQFNIIIDEEIKSNFDDKLNNDILDEINLFFSIYNPPINIDLYITNDLYTKRKSFICGLNDFNLVEKSKNSLKKYRGCLAFGTRTSDNFSVLLSYNIFKISDKCWRGTIHHECTHACDYYNYLNYNNIIESDKIYETEFFREFWLWSEFHARLHGCNRNFNYLYYSLQSIEYKIDPKQSINK